MDQTENIVGEHTKMQELYTLTHVAASGSLISGHLGMFSCFVFCLLQIELSG